MPTKTKSEMPEGYVQSGGTFPPFVTLGIGESLHGQLFRVRTLTRLEKVKGKGGKITEIEREKTYFDLTLIEAGDFNLGGVKSPSYKSLEAGETVTLSAAGGIFYGFLGECLKVMDVDKDTVPDWSQLYGRRVWIERKPDGKVSKGEFKGNKRNVYVVAFSPLEK